MSEIPPVSTPPASAPAPSPIPTPVPPVAKEIADAARLSFLWSTHSYLGEYARFADTKAAFAGTLAGASLAYLYGAGMFTPLLKTFICAWNWVHWLTLIAGVMLCVVIGLALHVVRPRLNKTGITGYIFWGGIAAFGSADEFKKAFHARTEAELTEALRTQVFDVSQFVLVPKYRTVSHCLSVLAIGLVFAGASLLVKDATSQPATSPAPATAVQGSATPH